MITLLSLVKEMCASFKVVSFQIEALHLIL